MIKTKLKNINYLKLKFNYKKKSSNSVKHIDIDICIIVK